MFFYLSKILWFCLQPSALLLILLIAGAALLATRHVRAGRRLVLASTALLLIGGLLPLGTWLILPLEERFARADPSSRPVDGIVILGGTEDARVSTARHAHALNEAAERLTETAALARRGFEHEKGSGRQWKRELVPDQQRAEIPAKPSLGVTSIRSMLS